jgi:hypothetical protein
MTIIMQTFDCVPKNAERRYAHDSSQYREAVMNFYRGFVGVGLASVAF